MDYRPKCFPLPEDGILPALPQDGIEPYVFEDAIAIAVDVALATDRPLLVSGMPGCGKSRLAQALATLLGWRLLSETITSRTRLETLTAGVDQLRRLNDAQLQAPLHNGLDTRTPAWRSRRAASRQTRQGLRPDGCYLEPGIFWWAFDAQSAVRRGLPLEEADRHRARRRDPAVPPPIACRPLGTVLLIDEIDKAEPDLPNDLLLPLDRRRFDLPSGFFAEHDGETRDFIAAPQADRLPLLLVITTNGERELPQAFIRRCVLLDIPPPQREQLIRIARQHHPDVDTALIGKVADALLGLREQAIRQLARQPGTAELLDAVHACKGLAIGTDDVPGWTWSHIERAVLAKDPALGGQRS